MNFVMSVTVGLEISSISTDELSHECYCEIGDLGYICRRTWPRMLLWGWKSQVYLKMNLTMCVTVGLEISGISIEERGHECCCGVGDLGYI